MKLMKELFEGVITSFNKEDPSNPEVQVSGSGRYNLKSLKRNVRNKLKDLYDGIADTDDAYAWKQADWKLNNAALREMIKTITEAEKELQAIRKKGGVKSKGIKKEDLL
jgi:hypothetical protein